MAQGMVFSLICLVSSIGDIGGEGPKSSIGDESAKLRLEVDSTKAALESERQKSEAIQKLSDAQRSLIQDLQKQLDELRRSMETINRDREQRLKAQLIQAEDLKKIQSLIERDKSDLAKAKQDLEGEILRLQRENESLKQQCLQEQLKAKTLENRSRQLTEELELVSKRLTEARNKTVSAIPVSLTKPNPIRGKIKEVQGNGLILVSVGTTEGVKTDDVLEVYRLGKDDPKASVYLGQVTILKTSEKEAVGRFSPIGKEKLPKVGDDVANMIGKK